jgi:hypothetical protein
MLVVGNATTADLPYAREQRDGRLSLVALSATVRLEGSWPTMTSRSVLMTWKRQLNIMLTGPIASLTDLIASNDDAHAGDGRSSDDRDSARLVPPRRRRPTYDSAGHW